MLVLLRPWPCRFPAVLGQECETAACLCVGKCLVHFRICCSFNALQEVWNLLAISSVTLLLVKIPCVWVWDSGVLQ